MIPNHHQFYPIPSHYYYHHSYVHHGYEMFAHQRLWNQPYSNDGSRMYSMVNNSNRSFYSNNQRKKQCYGCGSIHHLRAQCPQFQANTLQR